MRHGALASVALSVLLAWPAAAQELTRAWQQRIPVEVPLSVPAEEAEAVNPFFKPLETAPKRTAAEDVRKVDVQDEAVFAALVEETGTCMGGVPIHLPFPKLTGAINGELLTTRFRPAEQRGRKVPAWVVLGLTMEGKVKRSSVLNERFELPDPAEPQRPERQGMPELIGRLGQVQALATDEVSEPPFPKKVRVRTPSRDVKTPIRALVHVSERGAVNRYIALELPSGLEVWFEAYLATWRFTPATADGAPTDAWLVYSGVASLDMSGIDSDQVRLVPGITFPPKDLR